jgi:diguanylate cyclase (GGDEF)-like protein
LLDSSKIGLFTAPVRGKSVRVSSSCWATIWQWIDHIHADMGISYDHCAATGSADPQSEQERLSALDRYDLLDTPAEESFDRITRLTRRIFNVPMSTITLIDGHRQWFKSRQGVANQETERRPALCDVAIRQSQPLVVADTHLDPRFAANPFVIGAPFIRFYAGAQLRSPDGHAIGTLCAMDTKPRIFSQEDVRSLVDLARVVTSELELRSLAMSDSLTGALSRRAFRDEADRALGLARRHRHELSCIMFDLDHFKAINDTYGHGIGDLVLRATVDVCRDELRVADVIGRVGGEEFAVLLPHTGLPAALTVAEKLRVAIAKACVQSDHGTVRVTASFGVSALDAGTPGVDEILRRADMAAYAAKAAGRNACQVWRAQEVAESHPSPRRRVLKGAQIAFNGGRTSIDCTVRELSDTSARLSVISTADIPEEFKLGIVADQVHRLCRVTLRRDGELEVAFQ